MVEWAAILGCEVGLGDLTYLGTQIGHNPSSVKFWDPLLIKINSRLDSWDSDNLFMAGRLVLLNASLDSIPTFWFGLFKIPQTVLHSLE